MRLSTHSLTLAGLAFATLFLSACATPGGYAGGNRPDEGAYKVGKPYKVNNVWYYPKEKFDHVETGIASWYGPTFHGKKTANGETYDQNEMSAAHRTLQMPSFVRVTNLENGKSVVVRVNDRGPYLRGRVIDVSKRAADLLGFINKGTARVRLEVLEQESRQLAEVARQGGNTRNLRPEDMAAASIQAEPALQPVAVVASAEPEAPMQDDALPESLQTPTITVEELGAPAAAQRPSKADVPVHMAKGRVMPDAVVATEPVRPTGIFVQAGSFGVEANAQTLARRLSSMGRVSIEPANVGGKKVFRVKVGPLASVAQADAVLAKIVAAGQSGARVVKNKT